MKKFELSIVTTNSAFEDAGPNYEVARILRELADKVEEGGQNVFLIRDHNGNSIGMAEIK